MRFVFCFGKQTMALMCWWMLAFRYVNAYVSLSLFLCVLTIFRCILPRKKNTNSVCRAAFFFSLRKFLECSVLYTYFISAHSLGGNITLAICFQCISFRFFFFFRYYLLKFRCCTFFGLLWHIELDKMWLGRWFCFFLSFFPSLCRSLLFQFMFCCR